MQDSGYGPQGPPPYGAPNPPGYGAPRPPGYGAPVPNYLAQSILCTIFCCLPFGIVAIVFAAQVNGKFMSGDYHGALQASEQAKMWCWISFGIGLVPALLMLLYFLFVFIMVAVMAAG